MTNRHREQNWPQWRSALTSEFTPVELRTRVDEISLASGDEFITDQQYQKAREAWAACRLAGLIGARTVQMRESPDCTVTDEAGNREPVEITEALEPGRLRTREY